MTREQVDEFVDILLPICLEGNIYLKNLKSSMVSIKSLASIRPRRVIPLLVKNLEASLLSPELSLRVTRSLMTLAYAVQQLTSFSGVLLHNADEVSLGPQQYEVKPN